MCLCVNEKVCMFTSERERERQTKIDRDRESETLGLNRDHQNRPDRNKFIR